MPIEATETEQTGARVTLNQGAPPKSRESARVVAFAGAVIVALSAPVLVLRIVEISPHVQSAVSSTTLTFLIGAVATAVGLVAAMHSYLFREGKGKKQ